MLLKKYWKSSLFIVLLIFAFALFDVYIDNYPSSIKSDLYNYYFWINVVSYIGVYISFVFFMDFIVCLRSYLNCKRLNLI